MSYQCRKQALSGTLVPVMLINILILSVLQFSWVGVLKGHITHECSRC